MNKNLIEISFIFVILFCIFFLLNLFVLNTRYILEYLVIVFSFFITMCSYLVVFFRVDRNILHPLTLVTALYVCIFHLCPIFLISTNNTTCYGAYVMDGCIKATIIFQIGYFALLFGYTNTKISHTYALPIKRDISQAYSTNKLIITCYLVWFIGWMISMIVMIRSGKSFKYIISLGTKGSNLSAFDSFGASGGFNFLGKMANCMVIPWGIIWFVGKNKLLKYCITFLTFASFYITGYRYMIIIMAMTFIVTYYRVKDSHPSFKSIIIVLAVMLMFISVLGYARSSMRAGKIVDWSDFGVKSIEYALVSNFNIFLPFYGVVKNYPSRYFYTLGHSMFYESLIYFIPRFLWPSKPIAKISSSYAIAVMNSTNEFTIQTAGMAWPNIGEYYLDFGILGVIVFMYLYGKIMKKSISLYNSDNILNVVLAGVILGAFFQCTIRGYTPNNLGFLVFLFLPIIPIRYYALRKTSK